MRRLKLVPGSVVLIHLSGQELIGLLESLADRYSFGNDGRHKVAYRLSDRFKLWNAHILNAVIGDRVERGMIGSRGINRVERDLGKWRGLLIVRVLVNRGPRPRRHAGPAKGLACQGQVLRTGGPGHELEGGILVAAALNHVQGPRPQPMA